MYEPELTIGLPRKESVGTAMNALAHAAEALYAGPCEDASIGAREISTWLPVVVSDGSDLEARTALLDGAMHAGMALGAMNALCLAPALRFNEPEVPELTALAEALGTDDPPGRVEELARLGGFERLRDFGVPEAELPEVAAETAARPAARSNPRSVSPADVESLLRSIW